MKSYTIEELQQLVSEYSYTQTTDRDEMYIDERTLAATIPGEFLTWLKEREEGAGG